MRRNRKWEKVLLMVLVLSAVILVVLLVAQLVSIRQKDRNEPGEETQESTEERSKEESQTQESQTEPVEQVSTEVTEVSTEEQGYIIIGDSHIVVTDGMGYSVRKSRVEGIELNRNLFLVHTGLDPAMGTIEWLSGDGSDRIEDIIAEHTEISQWNIISMHGTSMVTMPDIKERYVSHYQNWIDERFRDCHVYIVSVPPLDEKEWVARHPDMPSRSNQDIVSFNVYIKDAFPDRYFDYYDWFLERSDAFQDEIHYTGETYCEMFDEIIGEIQKREND